MLLHTHIIIPLKYIYLYFIIETKVKVKVTGHTAKYGDPYSEFVLCILPIQVHTYSSEHTQTMNTQPEQWAAIYAVAPGEQLGVRCLA